MALTGLDIYKHLPRTNCKECGFPTCLAFAMSLSQKKTELSKCIKLEPAQRLALEEAALPPQKLVTVGLGEKAFEVGNETSMFRHEQTFWHPTAIAVELDDTLSEDELISRSKQAAAFVFERVGQKLVIQALAVRAASGNADKYSKACRTAADNSGLPLMLGSDEPSFIGSALRSVGMSRPLIYGANAANAEKMAALAIEHNCPLAVKAATLEEAAALSDKLRSLGVVEMVIDIASDDTAAMINQATTARRAALRKAFRPLGFPVMTRCAGSDDQLAKAITAVCKYSSIVILKDPSMAELMAITAARQGVYTDPRKPMQIDGGIYKVGQVNAKSPVMVTTNFSLTYFTVEPEVASSKIASYILVINAEGMSVLTAYAADKLNSEIIAKALKESGIESEVTHRKVIIPGYVSMLSGKLQEDSGWEVMVGPREATAIGTYLKTVWK